MTIGHTAAPYVHIVMDDGLAHEIDAQHRHSCPRPHGGSGVPTASTPAKPWGNHPLCPACNRGAMGCICNAPEPEPEYFKPAVRHDPDGWNRVEF